jgi:hypothetical protein
MNDRRKRLEKCDNTFKAFYTTSARVLLQVKPSVIIDIHK